MKMFAHETIIIDKEAWKFMQNFERQRCGFKPLTDDQFDRLWQRVDEHRNNCANPATHPIKKDEIRIDKDSFNMKWDAVKQTLRENGFKYRQDGFVVEGAYM